MQVGVPFSMEIDMWSLGCLLLELYIGRVAFTGHDKMDVMNRVRLGLVQYGDRHVVTGLSATGVVHHDVKNRVT